MRLLCPDLPILPAKIVFFCHDAPNQNGSFPDFFCPVPPPQETLNTYNVKHDQFDFESELGWEGSNDKVRH